MKTSLNFVCCICVICAICGSAFAGTRSSANYSIATETIDAGGIKAQSANYRLHDSEVGEFGSGSSDVITSAAYTDKIAYAGQLSDMLEPITAGSRVTHGGSGTFDIDLPLIGTVGVECRTSALLGAGNYKMVFTFGNPLTSVSGVSATATGGGVAPFASGAIDNTDAHQYVVNLSGVPNAQYVTVTLTNVMDSDVNFRSIIQGSMGVLLGDVNATGRVDVNDVFQVRQQSLLTPNSSNFRMDIDASGRIDVNDVFTARQQNLTGLP
jgi:hypothetical protein